MSFNSNNYQMKIKIKKLTYFKSLFGLSFKKRILSVYFETSFGIHTFFMTKPIDVIVLDEDFIVRDLRMKLKPFRIFIWNPKYFRVVEGPSGFIKKNKIKIGSRVNLEFID